MEPRVRVVILAVFLAAGTVTLAQNWPSFRGSNASGVADGQHLPLEWDAETGNNIKWKTHIPGLAHSSPVVWGERLFVPTSLSGKSLCAAEPGNS